MCYKRLFSICLLLDMLITLKNHFCFYSLGLRCLPCRHEQRRRRRQVWRQQRQRRATAHKWQLHHCDSHSNGIFKMHFIFQQKLDDNILFLSYCHLIFNMSLESQMVNYHNVLLGTFPSWSPLDITIIISSNTRRR